MANVAPEKTSFWQKLGGVFGKPHAVAGVRRAEELPPVGQDGLLMQPEAPAGKAEKGGAETGGFLRRRTSDQTVAIFEEGFANLVELMGSINTHLQEQVRRHERLSDSLRSVPQVLETMAESTRTQTGLMQAISEHLAGQKFQNQQMNEALRSIPQVAQTQSEMMGNIARQLEVQADTDVQMSQTIGKLTTTLDRMNRSAEAQLSWLEQARQAENNTLREVQELMGVQARRTAWLTGMLFVLAGVVLVGGAVMAVLYWWR